MCNVPIKCCCGIRLAAPDDVIGKRAKFPKCRALLTITAPGVTVCEWRGGRVQRRSKFNQGESGVQRAWPVLYLAKGGWNGYDIRV